MESLLCTKSHEQVSRASLTSKSHEQVSSKCQFSLFKVCSGFHSFHPEQVGPICPTAPHLPFRDPFQR